MKIDALINLIKTKYNFSRNSKVMKYSLNFSQTLLLFIIKII